MKTFSGFSEPVRKGISGKIVSLLFLFGVVPLALLSVIFLAFYIEGEILHIHNIQKEIADRISSDIRGHFENLLKNLRAFAELSDLRHADTEKAEALIYNLLDDEPEVDAVTVADMEGRVFRKISRYHSFSPSEGGSLAKEESFLIAKGGKTHISGIYFSPFSNLPQVDVTIPITDLKNKNQVGVLRAALNISRMWDLISSHRIGENRYAYIVDQDGNLILHKDISTVLQKRNLKHLRLLEKLIAEDPGVSTYDGLTGNRVIGAGAFIPVTRWGVLVEEPVASAYKVLYAVSLLFLFISLSTISLAIVIGMRFSFRTIIDPIKRLQEGAETIAGGEFEKKITIEGSDELSQLASSFNVMAENLQTTTVSRDRLAREMEERKRAERELRKLASVVEHISELVTMTTLQGQMIFLNEAGGRMLGISPAEAGGYHIRDILPDPLKKRFEQEILPATLGRGNWEGDLRYRNLKTGALADVHAMTFTIRDPQGEPLYLANISFDIAERKRVEEALQLSRRQLQAHVKELTETRNFLQNILDSTIEDITTTDLHGRVLFQTSGVGEMTGYDKSEIIGRKVYLFYEKGIEDARVVMDALMKQGELRNHEMKLRKKNGELTDIILSASLLRDEHGAVIGTLGVYRDITDRKKLEAQLLQAQKIEAIGTLAGGVAHDFNNLLMGIQGYTSLMLSELDSHHVSYKRLQDIETLVQSGAELTKQLLGFAQGGRYEVKPIDLNKSIEKTLKLFKRTKKELSIHRRYEKNLWTVEADRGQIEQALLNLYVNAWQAMPGGGDLYLETRNVTLDEGYTAPLSILPGRYVKVSVTDTGLGMDPKTRERIFEPFFTTKEMGRGTGLGLATVYGIIKGHRGHINVYSEKGKGTTFTLYLPVSEQAAVQEKEARGDLLRGHETILLVDDEKTILEVNRELLENLGYRVLTAGSGREAIEIFTTQGNEIDLVILDMIMPEMSGEETFDRLKETAPGVDVILSSGYSLNRQAIKIMEKGCRSFIQKPFTFKTLSHKVREVLDHSGE